MTPDEAAVRARWPDAVMAWQMGGRAQILCVWSDRFWPHGDCIGAGPTAAAAWADAAQRIREEQL